MIGPIGKSDIEVRFVEVLNEVNSKVVTRKAMNIYYEFKESLRELSAVKDKRYRRWIADEWRNVFMKRVDEMNAPLPVKTHLKGCLTVCWRTWCNGTRKVTEDIQESA